MGDSIEEFQANLDHISDLLLAQQKKTGVKLLWATQNLFSHPRYKDGAATAPNFDSFAYGCAQVRKMLDIGKKLGEANHVFWGGREGFQTPLNTKVKQELDTMAAFLKMAATYKKIIGFLHNYGLASDFKINVEPNHTTLAGHDYEHDLRMSSAMGMLGSIDCNAGQPYLGWDTDEFPSDPRKALLCMQIVLEQGGIAPGGNNFDCKLRRESTDIEDMFIAHIGGMDTLALGLKGAAKLIQEGIQASIVKQRYLSWDENPLAGKVQAGEATLEEMEAYAKTTACPWKAPQSSKQEQMETLINRYI